MRHKHADLIHAWADGAEIEWRSKQYTSNEWYPCNNPSWDDIAEYRLKQKPDVVKYLICGLKSWVEVDDQVGHECIKIVVDGKGRLKSAEVI